MKLRLQESLNRLPGVQVGFNKIEKRGGFYVAIYTLCVPIPDADEDEEKGEKS
jgi:hypothetical protein